MGWGQREDVKLADGAADGIQVVLIVPEHLIDFIVRQNSGVMRYRVAAIEMKDLKSARSCNS